MQPNLMWIGLWIAALRSGQYQQGRGALKRVNEKGGLDYCCLGVACELALGSGTLVGENYIWLDAATSYLPTENGPLDSFFGLDMRSIRVSRKYCHSAKAFSHGEEFVQVLNDNNVIFDKIADALEAKFLPNMRHS